MDQLENFSYYMNVWKKTNNELIVLNEYLYIAAKKVKPFHHLFYTIVKIYILKRFNFMIYVWVKLMFDVTVKLYF